MRISVRIYYGDLRILVGGMGKMARGGGLNGLSSLEEDKEG